MRTYKHRLLTSLVDTSCDPYYHFHHRLKSLSVGKHLSVDFHHFSTALLLRADRHTAAGLPPPQQRPLMLAWQRSRRYSDTGKAGEAESKVCEFVSVCMCIRVWGMKQMWNMCDMTFSLFCVTEQAFVCTDTLGMTLGLIEEFPRDGTGQEWTYLQVRPHKNKLCRRSIFPFTNTYSVLNA